MKIILFGSLPFGRGGMEQMIHVLKNNKRQFDSMLVIFYDFHNGKGKIASNEDTLILPNKNLPRAVQTLYIAIKLKSIISRHGCDILICLDDKSCYISKLVKLLTGKPTFASATWLHRSINTFKDKKSICSMDFHIAISEGIKKQLTELRINPQKIHLLPNCNYNDTFPHAFPALRKNETIHFLYVGRIQFKDQKYIKDLLLAFSKIKSNCQLDLVGDGTKEEVKKCKEFCVSLGIQDYVTFHGWKLDAWDYLEHNQITNIAALCLTSTYEGFPLVLIEAISRGIFCISSDCETGPQDIITSENGILFPVHDIQKLYLSMENSIFIDKDRLTIRNTAFKYSKNEYIKTFTHILYSIYHEYQFSK